MKPKINLLDFNRRDMLAFFDRLGEKKFRATQVLQWMHHYGVEDFSAMSNISKSLRLKLSEISYIGLPVIKADQLASDGTRKWVLTLDQGNDIETVFIPEEGRGTLCVSSQVGCALECRFCSTAQQGFNRNLTVAEIIGQVLVANKMLERDPKGQRIITNVVFMGMGEPLLNFDNVVNAMDIMMDDFAYGLSKRRVTLSTSGVIPALQRLKDVSDVSLAVSLHAPNDELRNQLVPINKKYPIDKLLQSCHDYVRGETRRKITFEYVMLENINDSLTHAQQLARLLKNIPAKVNLIPFNPFPGSDYRCSPRTVIDQFRDVLMQAGIITTTRKTRGEDIDAACGQLVGKVIDRTKRSQRNVAAPEKGVAHA